jgi:hypothetical protein
LLDLALALSRAVGPSGVTLDRDEMRATGLRRDGCVTLHPLRAVALIALVDRNGRALRAIGISKARGTTGSGLNASLTLSIIDKILCAKENFAH